MFATPYVEASDWRETLRNHARLMRKTFMGNPILCDLILIRAALSPKAARVGAQEMERAIANLVEAGLSPEDAFDTYSAVSLHVRGSVVLQRLYEKNQSADNSGPRAIEDAVAIDPQTTPLIAQVTGKGHRIGAPDERNFEYGLDCILDHAGGLIEEGKKAAKPAPSRQRKAAQPAAQRGAGQGDGHPVAISDPVIGRLLRVRLRHMEVFVAQPERLFGSVLRAGLDEVELARRELQVGAVRVE